MLGELNGLPFMDSAEVCDGPIGLMATVESRAWLNRLDLLRKVPAAIRFISFEPLLEDLGELDLRGFSWAIIGGESGPTRRPCEVEWITNAARECRKQGVAVFVKQDSAALPGRQGRLPNDVWALKEFPSTLHPAAKQRDLFD